jgi:Cu/Ag efflux pump CusA
MAMTVIGGVMVSTVLSLIVVPCVYSVFARKRRVADEPEPEVAHA